VRDQCAADERDGGGEDAERRHPRAQRPPPRHAIARQVTIIGVSAQNGNS